MPVNISKITPDGRDNEPVAWLCDGEWLLTLQVEALCDWLKQFASALPPADYVADVGFCWRRNATSGGPIVEPADMGRMAALRMSLHLSEYGGFADDSTTPGEPAVPVGLSATR